MVSALDKAKRALVPLMQKLAAKYGCAVGVGRDSSDKDVTSAFRKLSRQVHPDKQGGNTADQQQLTVALDAWQEERSQAPGSGGSRKPRDAAASGWGRSLGSATQS